MLVIIIICLIGLLVGSVFGIFFSGEDSGTGRAMPDVVAELSSEFYNQIEVIKADNPHDIADIDAISISWLEVLAVYAVKTATDPENAVDVATLDDEKIARLREILNDMAALSSHTTTETREMTTVDEAGNEYTDTISTTTLHITLEQKSTAEMALEYGFSDEQTEQLNELLSDDYRDLWAGLLGGYSCGGEVLVGDGTHVPKGIFGWPLADNYRISSRFGYRTDPITGKTKYHSGVDFAAPGGAPILASADGTVIKANSTDSYGGGWGYHVKIQHDGGFSTLYAHCSKLAVAEGETVVKGQVIAYVGSTGKSTGNHLHWEVYQNGSRVDPLSFFD